MLIFGGMHSEERQGSAQVDQTFSIEAVLPSTETWSSVQPKCSLQVSVRGWKRLVSAPVSESGQDVLSPFRLLHPPQDRARLSNSLPPPFTSGTMCSISKISGEKSSGVWQYSQRPLARWPTKSRSAGEGLRRLAMSLVLDAKLFRQCGQGHVPQACQASQ
jgi:hypothetical protein